MLFSHKWLKLLIILFFVHPGEVFSQENETSLLDAYVEEGLRNNLILKQKEISYQKSLLAVREAKSLFYPDLSLAARYSVARGGRVIEIPVGDLVNPVYQSLNALLDAAANFQPPVVIQEERFPNAVLNQEINFLRETEHETKLRLVQPVIQPEIFIQKNITEDLAAIEDSKREVFKQELTAQIKTAYYRYLIAREVRGIIHDGLELVQQHLRKAEILVNLKKATTYAIYRTEAEKSKIEADLVETEGHLETARSYFNFLLNRPFSSEILVDTTFDTTFQEIADMEVYLESAIVRRKELHQVDLGLNAAQKSRKLEMSKRWPSLVAVVDYGFQGEQYRFNQEDDFFMASLALRWHLFDGFRRKTKIQEAELELKALDIRKEEAVNQIKLEVITQYQTLKTARRRMLASESQVSSALRSFQQVNALYENKKATTLEWLDGRNLLTNSRKEVVIKQYEYLILWAEFHRILGL